jgi:hypothetical protein
MENLGKHLLEALNKTKNQGSKAGGKNTNFNGKKFE